MTLLQFSLFDDVPESAPTVTHTIPVRAHTRRVVGESPPIAPDPQVRVSNRSGERAIQSPRIAPAVHNGTDTSRAAARGVDGSGQRVSDYQRVLEAIRASGANGLTRTEIAQITGVSPDSVRPRVAELLGRSKGLPVLVKETGEVRINAGGRSQSILVALDIAESDRLQ